MSLGVIYKINIGDKTLFGSTIEFNKRRNHYTSCLGLGNYSNNYLQRSYNKYGADSFKIEIVQDNIPESILLDIENIWMGANCTKIQDKKKGLNVRDAQKPTYTEADRLHQSEVQKEKFKNLSEGDKERKRIQLRKAYDDNKEQIIKSIAKTKANNPLLPWEDKRCTPILQISLDGIPIKLWPSAKQIEKESGYNESVINRICNNKYYSNKFANYIWRIATDEELFIYDKLKDAVVPLYKKESAVRSIKQFNLDTKEEIVWPTAKSLREFLNLDRKKFYKILNNKEVYNNCIFE